MWPDRSQVGILTNSNQFSEVVIRSIGKIDNEHKLFTVHVRDAVVVICIFECESAPLFYLHNMVSGHTH